MDPATKKLARIRQLYALPAGALGGKSIDGGPL